MILNYEAYNSYVESPFWSYLFSVYEVLNVGSRMHVVPNLKEEWIPPPTPVPNPHTHASMLLTHVTPRLLVIMVTKIPMP